MLRRDIAVHRRLRSRLTAASVTPLLRPLHATMHSKPAGLRAKLPLARLVQEPQEHVRQADETKFAVQRRDERVQC